MTRHIRLLTSISLLGTIPWVTVSSAQPPAAMIIVSPSAGSMIQPGQALTISVHVASGTYPKGVAVIGQDPLGSAGFSPVVDSAASFTLGVPANTSPGLYKITAVSVDSTGAMVSSKPVTIDVERADVPTQIKVYPPSVTLELVGDTLLLTIFGVFPGGGELDLTHSSKLRFISENTSVAVAQDGVFSAVGVGQTNIDVQYGPISEKLRVTVPAGTH
jgi:hypothetical protein